MNTNDFLKAFRGDAKGGAATSARAISTFRNLQSFSKERSWRDVTPASLSPKQVRQFVEHRISSGAAGRTVQNEVSHLRRSARGAGRALGNLKDQRNGWSSSRLSLPGASRIGGRAAVRREDFAEAREKVEPNIRAVMDLQAELGLRSVEAIKCTNANEWSRSLQQAQKSERGAYLQMSSDAGSKGGRPRHIYISQDRVEVVLQVVDRAIEARQQNNGHLIDRDSLTQAKQHYSYICKTVDFVGNSSAHGLRRMWAKEQLERYSAEGLDQKQGLKRLSQDLGHGDGRGRWVLNNYIHTVEK